MEAEETFLEYMVRVIKKATFQADADYLRSLSAVLWFQAKRSVDNKFLGELCAAFVWAADEIDRNKERAKNSVIFRRVRDSSVIKWKEKKGVSYQSGNGPAI